MDHQLLEKYFQGKCNAREKAEIEAWLRKEEELPDAGFKAPDNVMLHEWSSMQHRIKRSTARIRLRKLMGVAATICVLIAAGLLWHHRFKAPLQVVVNWKTMQVPNGKKAQLSLSDGSTVYLNGGACITYATPFESNRIIKLLQGEVFFDIATDPVHPFNVQTADGGTIKVLGTRFNVKHNSYPGNLEITLNSGRISFSQQHQTVYLNPGERLTYDLVSHSFSTPVAIDTLKTTSWRQGILLFRNTPVQQVFNELEQHFGVKFIIDKKIEGQLFTAELNKESLPAILRLMELSSDLRFRVDGQTIHVY